MLESQYELRQNKKMFSVLARFLLEATSFFITIPFFEKHKQQFELKKPTYSFFYDLRCKQKYKFDVKI